MAADWLSELKPSSDIPSFLPPLPVIPQKRSNQGETPNNPPQIHARPTGLAGLAGPPSFHPPNNAALVAPTAPTMHNTSVSLKTPRPDIYVAISSEVLIQALYPVHRLFLDILERDGVFISNPNPQGSGSHFPFFMVELKASATGGTLFQGQNQAAVSGASAVGILRELDKLHRSSLDLLNAEVEQPVGGGETERQQTQVTHTVGDEQSADDTAESVPPVAFSAVAEGPVHELWMHFYDARKSSYGMSCIGIWRTTDPDDALQLTCMFAAILQWGAQNLKPRVVKMLKDVARARGFV